MLLDSDEFIRLKPQYVPGVLDILRRLARRTACTYIPCARTRTNARARTLTRT